MDVDDGDARMSDDVDMSLQSGADDTHIDAGAITPCDDPAGADDAGMAANPDVPAHDQDSDP